MPSMESAALDEKMWHLQHCPLFSGIGPEEMEHLQHTTVMVKLEPQERILTNAEDMHVIWLIKEGLVSLTYGDAAGRDATVLLLGPGDLFGALEDTQEQEYGENIVALKPTVLCRMTQQQMEDLLHKYPGLGYRVTKFSWRRIARLQQRLAEIMTKSVKVRLATLLLKLATDYGADTDAGRRSLGLTITHDDLARLVGSSREMVSKVMGQFRQEGLVRSTRKNIELADLATLQSIADSNSD
ncbi:MAG: helix-turn-helix domain-containing protein [Candidatus Latescibacteria bacterium]|nr:helix-turn-helix domain-containing protein [Candidatus Latescibacterota bacterium]